MTDDAYNDSRNSSPSSSSSLPNNSLVLPLHLLGILSYLSLLGWFSNRMKQSGHYHNSSSTNFNNNTLEEWIGRTIAVGLCAVVLRCLEYLLFDHTGSRHPFVAIVTAFGNATKHGLTRALLVGLSTGVGVLPSRLGCGTLLKLVALTLVYIAVVTGLDYWTFQDQQQQQQEDAKHDENDNSSAVRTGLLAAKAFMEFLFWCWMWIALCRTMTDLRRMDRPVLRYRALFWILLLLAIVSGAVLGAVITERTDYGSIGLADNRGLSQLDEVCVFFMLLTAAILWRPGQIMSSPSSSSANMSGQRSNLRRHHEQNDLELMRSITTESNPDIPEDSPLVKDETTFA